MRLLVIHRQLVISIILALGVVTSIGWYAWNQGRHYRHFHTVKPGILLRSGQLTRKGLERILYEENVGTLVNLRGNESRKEFNTTSWEEQLCEKAFVRFVALPLGSPEDKSQITREQANRIIDQAAAQFLEILSDPVTYPRPVLVHCLAGMHRTGVMAALYRIEHENWTKEQAIAEMRALGYRDFVSYDPLRDYLLNWTPGRSRQTTQTSATR